MDSKSGYPPQEQQQQPQQQNIYPDVPPVNPPSYEQTVPQPMAATIVHQTVVQTVPLGPQPANLQCPSCHKQMVSNIKYESATKTHMFALLCCLLFWPCVWLPYTIDSCKDANHYCPYCDAYLGSYKD